MKRKFNILIVGAVILGGVLGLVGMTVFSQAAPQSEMVRKIVVFQPWFVKEAAKDELINQMGGAKIKNLELINGMAAYLPSKAAERALAGRPEVLRVDNDDLVFAVGKPVCDYDGICEEGETANCSDCKNGNGGEEPAPQPPQEPAWGVTRIGADVAWAESAGQGVKVAIIDSGIDLDHLDLADNIKGGYNAINSKKSWNDDYGHGTHVAGIVAALNNSIGVVGVAPEANLYAVKVLNQRGIGFASDVIEGLGWSVDNGMQVANMSIGSSGCSQSYHDAIISAYNAGITIAAAAGNNGGTGGSIVCPALWPETIAVSATNEQDGLAYFSSYGEEIDLAAPGQGISSTWNDGYYKVGSGTSMATPHVAGTAALILADSGLKCDLDLDGACNPAEIKQRLEGTAEWLSGLNSDQQGSGLVNAKAAVIE